MCGISAGTSGSATPSSVELRGVALRAIASMHAGDHVAQHRHHGEVVLDEAHLDVQADVLVEVARRVVRLGAEDRPDLEDALEDADHDLLVELRTLRQVRRAAKVVEREDVGAALGRRRDESWASGSR